MNLPVLFRHELESGVVSRTKQYEIKAHQFLVDVEDDVRVFLQHGWTMIAEGENAVERFAQLNADKADKNVGEKGADTPKVEKKAAASKKKSDAAK